MKLRILNYRVTASHDLISNLQNEPTLGGVDAASSQAEGMDA